LAKEIVSPDLGKQRDGGLLGTAEAVEGLDEVVVDFVGV
jgi:hypothetical protein